MQAYSLDLPIFIFDEFVKVSINYVICSVTEIFHFSGNTRNFEWIPTVLNVRSRNPSHENLNRRHNNFMWDDDRLRELTV
jgi:hypothetical protein